jgi:hypothetical protein
MCMLVFRDPRVIRRLYFGYKPIFCVCDDESGDSVLLHY